MGQSFNLGQVANYVNSSGQYNVANMNGTFGIAQGGTNNPSLMNTAGGILYVNGSSIQITNQGIYNQVLKTNGPSANPEWTTAPSTAMVLLGSTILSGPSVSVSPVSLSAYKFVLVEFRSAGTFMPITQFFIGSSSVNFQGSSMGSFQGSVLLDLTYGGCGGLGFGGPGSPNLAPAIGNHGYNTGSMSITASVMMTSFSNGSMFVWGVY